MDKQKRWEYGIIVITSVLLYLLLMCWLTGYGPLKQNVYNSYALQADSWRQGRLDLGQDYPYLELAVYNGKYYVSFPPFPSYILFPLTFIFGSNTPDALLMWFISLLSAGYLYRLALQFRLSEPLSALTTLTVILGSNATFNMLNPGAWFFAQNLCFLLAVMTIYYAGNGKGGWALFFWACSVGCRPMQIFFLPVVLLILYIVEKKKSPELSGKKIVSNKIYWGIPAGCVALTYMVLNYLRFGSIIEFGHNYLPEFIRAEHGQFSVKYMSENLKSLLHFFQFDESGKIVIDHFGNLSFMLASPCVIFAILTLLACILKKEYRIVIFQSGIIACAIAYLAVTIMHKTMGGWHFGNRYANDILPWIYLATVLGLSRVEKLGKYQIPIAVFGLCLNAIGNVVVYNGL
ncbi:hypothetical protein WMO27_17960 [Lachnospiraceae bacterium CLA-AA-H183]